MQYSFKFNNYNRDSLCYEKYKVPTMVFLILMKMLTLLLLKGTRGPP
jgi:hypothetical protein